jgi:low affinity Fe/Cu permease
MNSRAAAAAGPIERFSQAVSQWAGSSTAFAFAVVFVLVWALTGPVFHFSQGWQLVINTGTTIATFLMVFLIQRAQNKEARAVQLKLNEIVAALEGASNRLVGAEDLSEDELHALHERYLKLADQVQRRHGSLKKAMSVEETTGATAVHDTKAGTGA